MENITDTDIILDVAKRGSALASPSELVTAVEVGVTQTNSVRAQSQLGPHHPGSDYAYSKFLNGDVRRDDLSTINLMTGKARLEQMSSEVNQMWVTLTENSFPKHRTSSSFNVHNRLGRSTASFGEKGRGHERANSTAQGAFGALLG